MSKLSFAEVKNAAAGRWVDYILPQFGLVLVAKRHTACPVCGGNDRFRLDDKNGHGTFYCNQCGAGDGFKLISLYTNKDNSDVLRSVASVLGLVNNDQITPEVRAHWRAQAEAKAKADAEAKAKAQAAAARKALGIWSKCEGGGVSPYLDRKMINTGGDMGCKVERSTGDLIVPLRDENKAIVNIQRIKRDGTKEFISGSRVSGCYHLIGLIADIVCIAEGFSTAASIHMATGYPVVVAFNSNNLMPVGQNIRALYPDIKIIYCADNDRHLELEGKANDGMVKAYAAAQATGGLFCYPVFED